MQRLTLLETGLSMASDVIKVPSEIVHKWQEIVNVVAEIVHVPSALVMRVEPPNIKVLVASESSGNPYERDEAASLNTGLYCETVMRTRESLLVPDALADEAWRSNPDVPLGMISYLGFPILWPDGEVFGTLCVPGGIFIWHRLEPHFGLGEMQGRVSIPTAYGCLIALVVMVTLMAIFGGE